MMLKPAANLRNIARLGQVFTPPSIVRRMLSLRKNTGRVLEPSCGDGAFLRHLPKDAVGLEVDAQLLRQDRRVLRRDFFHYPLCEKFDSIIGNPPYVRFADIDAKTKKLLPAGFDRRANLYLFFIHKAARHLRAGGELIFITPRDFMAATSARHLNAWLFANGAFTHFYDLGDARIFKDAAPNCAIWRWVRGGGHARRIQDGRVCAIRNGVLFFKDKNATAAVGDYFQVCVGAVSGADEVFALDKKGAEEFACSHTAKTGKTRRMIYNRFDDALKPHKQRLLNRRIRRFNESNWWEWGRLCRQSDAARLYVNGKTRNPRPFFQHPARRWDGALLALFPRRQMDLRAAQEALNAADWKRAGFVCDGRFLFSQRALENAPFHFEEKL